RVQVVPRIDAGVVSVGELRAHRILAHRLELRDLDIFLADLQDLLPGPMASHLRGGRIDAQKLAGQAKALAVGERDLEHARLLVQQDLGGCRVVGVQTGHSRASWLIEDGDLSAVRQSQRSSRTCTCPSWMRTGKVSVGSYAGAVSASPVRMQKRAP